MNTDDMYREARQHLNLSYTAYDVIELDKAAFLPKASRNRILNLVLSLYRESADASIAMACDAYQEKLEQELKDLPDTSEKEALIAKLRETRCAELIQSASAYPAGTAFKFQLDKENYAYFKVRQGQDTERAYNGSVGQYIKAIIEEYARKPLVEREKIIYGEWIDQIEYAIAEHRILKLTLKSGWRYEVKPYCICTDPGYNYNYLVGLSKTQDRIMQKQVSAFRLSNISKMRVTSRSSRLKAEEKKTIEDKLRSAGVQFLLQETDSICIRLTAKGKRMYDTQLHLRPPFLSQNENPDGTWEYEFMCTPLQVQYYFFKFGADAEILSPKELRDSFKTQYAKALERYQ